jgi:hypothetical protein
MFFSRSSRAMLAAAALASSPLLISCADVEGRYDDFEARDTKIRESQGGSGGNGGEDGCTRPEPGAADGDFLLSLSARIRRKSPILFLAGLTTEATDSGLSFSLEVQTLVAADRKTPTGTPIPVGPFEIDADGSFVAELPPVAVPSDGNPISTRDIEAEITLIGSLCAPADFVCGDVNGALTEPLELGLDGSTFTLQRITDPDSYPEPVINCNKDPAAPLE